MVGSDSDEAAASSEKSFDDESNRVEVPSAAAGASSPAMDVSCVAASSDQAPSDLMPLALRIMLDTRGWFGDFHAWSWAALEEYLPDEGHAGQLSAKGFKTYFDSMVQYERFTTKALMEAASVYRLAADARARVYEVEIGAVLWKFPAKLRHRQSTLGKMESLGGQGPWIVSRLVG